MSYDGPTQFSISNNENIIFEGSLCTPTWGRYLRRVFSFDVDNNGIDDVILKSHLLGSTGTTSSIVNYNVFLIFDQNRIRLVEVSSYHGSDEAFVDIDGDRAFEFICTKRMIKADGSRYYLKNVFTLREEGVSNVTDMYPEYLGAFDSLDGSNKIESMEIEISNNIFPSPAFIGDACDKRNW